MELGVNQGELGLDSEAGFDSEDTGQFGGVQISFGEARIQFGGAWM